MADDLKRRIMQAAMERFLAEGFARVSVDDLAADLAMSKKTFYQVFDSKDDLVVQILERTMGEIRNNVEGIVGGDEGFIHKLHLLMIFLGQFSSKFSKPFLNDLQKHQPQLWHRIQEFRRKRILENFSRLLDQGIEEGFIRKDLQKRIFLLSYMNAIENVLNPTLLANESFSAREALEGIMGIFFTGVITDEARAQLGHLQLDKHSHQLRDGV